MASATISLFREAAIPFLFALTQADASITAQAAAFLSGHPVAETFIVDRVPYVVALANDLTAPESSTRA